jgi:large subunit ribosomal protein L1
MKHRSKRYQEAVKVGDFQKSYSLTDALSLLMKTNAPKFNETVVISAHLGVDPKQTDQMVRGTVSLPHGSGKKVRVVVFTSNPQEALDAGADVAGMADLIEKVQGGWMDFDVAISTVSAMKDVRILARVLGPRGLMPNPKSGTVTDDIAGGVKAVKAGRVEYKMDKGANVHITVGKRSFQPEHLIENAQMAIDALGASRPDGFKGKFIKSLTLAATMSPGVRLDLKEFSKY